MVKHIVMWKFADGDKADRVALATALADDLRDLVGQIPGLLAVDAQPDGLDEPGCWDLVLLADLENKAALDSYQVHPEHQKVAARIKAAAVSRAAVDYID